MFRFITISCLGLATIGSLSAGQIQIGEIVGGTNNGLTANYIAGGCANANGPSFAGCAAGSTGTGSISGNPNFFAERQFDGTLFSGATLNGATAPNAFGTGCAVGTNAGCLTDPNNVSFALINDGSALKTYWDAVGNGTQTVPGGNGTLTIPVGVFGTGGAWAMINNQWGLQGETNTVVKFLFGTSSNTTDAGSLTFNLVNGNQVRDATQCAAPNASGSNCTAFATTAPNSTNIFSANYSGNTGLVTAYTGTTGTVALDDQFFDFGTQFLGDYLSQVQITDQNGVGQVSRTGFSGLTVNVGEVVATPEPSTVMMLLAGLGAIGAARLRRKA